jgi:hypothetical protein
MPRLIKSISLIFIAVSFIIAQMQPVITDENGSGTVDWNKRMIIAVGIGAPNPNVPESARRPGALRAAKLVALRNALETIKGIYLNSFTTVQNFMTVNDVVSTNVEGYVKNFSQKGKEKYMSDGTVEVTMMVPLDGIGGVGDLILGSTVGENPSISSFEGDKAKTETIFTGLIIDCRGFGLKPALSPKVQDEDGNEIYGSAYVSKEWAVKYGIVGYDKDIKKAAKNNRVGNKPGQIKALKSAGQNNTDIIISNKDAEDIRSASKNLKFLSECRVIVVLD